MKAAHINPFLDSTINLFNNMLGQEPRVGQKVLLKSLHTHRWDISGVIGITGSAEGVVALRLTRRMVEALLERSGLSPEGGQEEESREIISSMVGEMTNVIAGNALGSIKQFEMDITVPFVVQGQDHSISWPRNNPVIAIPFSSALGHFEVDVSLKENYLYSILGEAGLA
ncbi:MAG: chemotaxis protein CheX [Spirochaetales bacterium]|nr:chemotaxis protein CheX [Spirochaetales bacterium]